MKLNFKKLKGLVPAIVQDYKTKKVLMLAFMNEAAWKKTLKTGMATYYSRSRNKIWTKGEESGNTQLVKEILVDCDEDTVLLKVKQVGNAACHTGYQSCFYREIQKGKTKVIGKKIFDPKEVYKK
jgi:phosphoribosyl-AMP cyclohydrolase